MLAFLKQFSGLVEASLAELELDEGYDPSEISDVEVDIHGRGSCEVSFPEIGVRYFASNWTSWSGQENDWLFSR